ncbi:hypothetical protein M8J76_007949 [Diaphorina citri]|nr:hypothetical protein M8J76_007949 [Diaphorina citri]
MTFNLWLFCCLLSVGSVWCWPWSNKNHCPDVTAFVSIKPSTGRWYVHASTSCSEPSSSSYRVGLFNNKAAKCQAIDFYSNGISFDVNTPIYFIDHAFNNVSKSQDQTIFDVYALDVDNKEGNRGVYVAESRVYYDDKKMHGSSEVSSVSSSEEKKHGKLAAGKHRFFFTALLETADVKVFYVCTKFNHLSQNKKVVWVLTKTPTPTPATIDSVKACLKSNKLEIYDSLTIVSHAGCKYPESLKQCGGYTFNGH